MTNGNNNFFDQLKEGLEDLMKKISASKGNSGLAESILNHTPSGPEDMQYNGQSVNFATQSAKRVWKGMMKSEPGPAEQKYFNTHIQITANELFSLIGELRERLDISSIEDRVTAAIERWWNENSTLFPAHDQFISPYNTDIHFNQVSDLINSGIFNILDISTFGYLTTKDYQEKISEHMRNPNFPLVKIFEYSSMTRDDVSKFLTYHIVSENLRLAFEAHRYDYINASTIWKWIETTGTGLIPVLSGYPQICISSTNISSIEDGIKSISEDIQKTINTVGKYPSKIVSQEFGSIDITQYEHMEEYTMEELLTPVAFIRYETFDGNIKEVYAAITDHIFDGASEYQPKPTSHWFGKTIFDAQRVDYWAVIQNKNLANLQWSPIPFGLVCYYELVPFGVCVTNDSN